MIIITSPSKTYNPKPSEVTLTLPLFQKETDRLLGAMLRNKTKLETVLGVSQDVAKLNRDRIENWADAATTPAAWSYRGETFFGLSIEDLSNEDIEYAQEHLYIVSGLYGLLRPTDGIKPYRLEMSTKLKSGTASNLYQFWDDTLSETIMNSDPKFVINCASKEYSKAALKDINIPIITPTFLHNGKSKMAFAKYSRGLMARWAIENRITDSKQLKQFSVEGYEYNQALSTDNKLVFVAPKGFSIKGRFTTL
ncbi:MAG: cytoplasmic iron level regulating protein YaaA (DUF328/UPF0246 family) [Candidatus Saccharimonadales bacterium]|jgi:cytoplasmic iron level regulating protein YaaA (DUF328/UPF0246 family)